MGRPAPWSAAVAALLGNAVTSCFPSLPTFPNLSAAALIYGGMLDYYAELDIKRMADEEPTAPIKNANITTRGSSTFE